MAFEKIDMEKWPRRDHYHYYTQNIPTSYQVNVMLDVTALRKRWLLPFGIYVNHAAADGYHTSMLLRDIQDMCDQCKDWIQ